MKGYKNQLIPKLVSNHNEFLENTLNVKKMLV